jgi:hypothetical protein
MINSAQNSINVKSIALEEINSEQISSTLNSTIKKILSFDTGQVKTLLGLAYWIFLLILTVTLFL